MDESDMTARRAAEKRQRGEPLKLNDYEGHQVRLRQMMTDGNGEIFAVGLLMVVWQIHKWKLKLQDRLGRFLSWVKPDDVILARGNPEAFFAWAEQSSEAREAAIATLESGVGWRDLTGAVALAVQEAHLLAAAVLRGDPRATTPTPAETPHRPSRAS